MSKIILTRGLPASGKSTWARQLIDKEPAKWKRINKDDLRSMLDAGKWSKLNETFVLKIRDELILRALLEGYNVIVDDTNLHPKHLERMHQIANEKLLTGTVEVEVKDFTDVSLDECIKRDRKRENYVGEKVIKQMYNQFLRPAPPKIEHNPKLYRAIICDLDGTLALLNGRDPYDATNCEQDELNHPVYDIVTTYKNLPEVDVLLVSGREEKYREQTKRWLEKHLIDYRKLYMRNTGDNRKDSIIKKEIYDTHIKGKYNILFVLDDRNQVVDFWRSEGLTCLQVGEGDF